MLLIPQLYIREQKVIPLERTISPLYDEDPFTMASRVKDSGGNSIYIVDLGIPHVGSSENTPIIQRIREELGLNIYIGGAFRNMRAIEAYMAMDLKMTVLETVAYQQPTFARDACNAFPEKVAVHIDVRAGKVTIPGWTVAANKTSLDYAEQFGDVGVRTFFYSDVGNDGLMSNDNFQNLLNFCKKVESNVICTSEIKDPGDIEKLVTLGAPHLEGLVLTRSLYEGRIDLNAAIDLIADLMVVTSNEPTMQED